MVLVAAVILTRLETLDGSEAPEKPIITKFVVANVWPGGYSEVSSLESSGPRIVTNIDFSVFGPSIWLEANDAIYDLIVLWCKWTPEEVAQEQYYGSADAKGFPKHWPPQLPPRNGPAQYVFLSTGPDAREKQLFDLLHRYYQQNRNRLEADARQREIDNQIASTAEAGRRALIPPHSGPPVRFKRIEFGKPTTTPPK